MKTNICKIQYATTTEELTLGRPYPVQEGEQETIVIPKGTRLEVTYFDHCGYEFKTPEGEDVWASRIRVNPDPCDYAKYFAPVKGVLFDN